MFRRSLCVVIVLVLLAQVAPVMSAAGPDPEQARQCVSWIDEPNTGERFCTRYEGLGILDSVEARPGRLAVSDGAGLVEIPVVGETPGSMAALSTSFQGATDSGWIPPDTNGAVGPSHVVTSLNGAFRVQTRAGGAVSQVTQNDFWAGHVPAGQNAFDPRTVYDPYSNRWIVAAVAAANHADSRILVGASTNSNPTTFATYHFDVSGPNTHWADFPTLGFTKDWVIISVNMFGISPNGWGGIMTFAIRKDDLYAGGGTIRAGFWNWGPTDCGGGGCGATLYGATTFSDTLATGYSAHAWDGGAGQMRLWSIQGAVGSETMGPIAFVDTPGTETWGVGGGNFAPQSGTTDRIESGDDRLHSLVYRNGALWMSHTAGLPASGPTRTAAQWWQVDPSGSVTQFGRIDDATGNFFYFYPSLAVNSQNDVLLGYSRSSATTFVGAYYAWRHGDEALNTLHVDNTLHAGEASYFKDFGGGRNRWGDYSSTVVDPNNDRDMWTVQEYAWTPSGGSDRWATWWGQVTYPANTAPTMTSLSCSPNPSTVGQTVTCSFAASDDSGGVSYTVNWGDGSPTTRVPASGHVAPGTTQSATHAWSGAGSFTVSVTATDSAFVPLTSAPRTTLQTVQNANAAPTMQSLSCSPNPSLTGQSVTCSFHATDDSSGVFYAVDWGDGTPTTRVPASGHVSPGATRTASHAWSSAGSFTVSVTATDNAATPLTSAPRTTTQNVGNPNTAPTMQSLSCSPNPGTVGQTITCDFRASDDSSGVFYTVSWDDGSPSTRVPATGFVSPGTTQSATHAWASVGTFTVSVTATDDAATPLTSNPMAHTQTIQAANAAPVMQALSCAPSPSDVGESVSCDFHAADASSGVFYTVDWGDGSPTTRVPASGHVAPGTTQTATHAWPSSGTFTVSVTATDNGSPELTSSPMTTTQDVRPDNAAPVMVSLSCAPSTSLAGESVTCSFQATDDSTGVFYTIDWGDGSPLQREPASGQVAPGTTQSASHAWSSAGSYTVSVTATDDAPTPRTSAPLTTTQVVDEAPNDAPVMQALSCAPASVQTNAPTTCTFWATDDSPGVFYLVSWGDGTTTRVPATGTMTPGATATATHAWTSPGTKTVSVTATDNGSPIRTSAPRTTLVTVTNPSCSLLRTGSLTVGLLGLDLEGVSARTEVGIPQACQGKLFELSSGSPAADFNICWHDAAGTPLGCNEAFGSDVGLIPSNAASARIILFLGVLADYRLAAT